MMLAAALLGFVAVLTIPSAAMAAPAYELNTAVAGTPPSGLSCVSATGVTICYEKDGDIWWVKDTKADSASAVADWLNYRNGDLYRQGGCRNALGSGKWGYCNKNYYETSRLVARACVIDYSADYVVGCTADYVFQAGAIDA
jgi:hypothetical protein